MMVYKRYIFFLLIFLALSCKQETAKIIPVDDFFKSQDKMTYRVSPNGEQLSYLMLEGKDQNLYVEDIASGNGKKITQLKGKNISFYFWVNNNELIYYK
ncbi:MAG: S9 family peptidase, partial [Pedobacter sp.]